MKAKAHWNGIAKPLHGLGLMEEIITQIVGIQNTVDVHIDKRAVIVMCADNGIVEESVTQTGCDRSCKLQYGGWYIECMQNGSLQ